MANDNDDIRILIRALIVLLLPFFIGFLMLWLYYYCLPIFLLMSIIVFPIVGVSIFNITYTVEKIADFIVDGHM